jgi:hypothetical protein
MGIHRNAVEFHREIFSIPGILASPFLTIGFQDVNPDGIPDDFKYRNMTELLRARGVEEVVTLDLFDARADLHYDLNEPVPGSEHLRYRTVHDIGSLEHIFDTKQALENCMAMVAVGGFYCLTTPVRGYYGHGLHTFNPELILKAFQLNGFEIVYEAYCKASGERVQSPDDARWCTIWIVGRKVEVLPRFVIPQQGRWAERYPA